MMGNQTKTGRVVWAITFGIALLGLGGWAPIRAADQESLSGWRRVYDLPASRDGTSPWKDVVLRPSVFTTARLDLGDLRLIDARGREVPYALRVRRSESRSEPIAAREFNRAAGPSGTAELSLDLGTDEVEHNEVVVELPGMNVRRRGRLEGSNDGQDWRVLVEKDLFHFQAKGRELEDDRLSYPPGRFRYLRLRVARDPEVDKAPVTIGAVSVRRRVESPGETFSWAAKLGPREPVRTNEGPGSAWILGLGGDHVPCERVEVEVTDAEFAQLPDRGRRAGGFG